MGTSGNLAQNLTVVILPRTLLSRLRGTNSRSGDRLLFRFEGLISSEEGSLFSRIVDVPTVAADRISLDWNFNPGPNMEEECG